MRSVGEVLLLDASVLCCSAVMASEAGEGYAEFAASAGIAIPGPAPDRDEGEGPFKRLAISNVMLVDGLGSPPRGPVSLVIEDDRISTVSSYPVKPEAVEKHIDGQGMTVLPGFIDGHTHIGNPMQGLAGPVVPPEYVFKLMLGHGVTTIRDVGSLMGLKWTVDHARRSDKGEITAPRIVSYAMFPGGQITDSEGAKNWVRAVKKNGALGVKLRGGTREAMQAGYEETAAQGMGTANHHDQNGVYHVNVLDSARMGLDSMEHWYGLPEAMFVDRTIQDCPNRHCSSL